MTRRNNKAICVIGDYKYLRKYLNRFVTQIRNEGNYIGEIIVLTSIYTPVFLLKLKDKSNLKFIKFNKIKFDKKTDYELKTINTNGQPNRHIYKNFQWHKLHLFDEKLKNWKYIFYIDINMTIHKDINPILDNTPNHLIFANRDSNDRENWVLKDQFDTTHKKFKELNKKYNLLIKDYFQTGMLYFDTDIVDNKTKDQILNLVESFPITRTNEQAILNLYFIFERNLYHQLPQRINNFTTYTYWTIDNNSRITKQLVPPYK